jgi:hypothetical protein
MFNLKVRRAFIYQLTFSGFTGMEKIKKGTYRSPGLKFILNL